MFPLTVKPKCLVLLVNRVTGGGGGSGVSGRGVQRKESVRQSKRWEGLGLEDIIFLNDVSLCGCTLLRLICTALNDHVAHILRDGVSVLTAI